MRNLTLIMKKCSYFNSTNDRIMKCLLPCFFPDTHAAITDLDSECCNLLVISAYFLYHAHDDWLDTTLKSQDIAKLGLDRIELAFDLTSCGVLCFSKNNDDDYYYIHILYIYIYITAVIYHVYFVRQFMIAVIVQ